MAELKCTECGRVVPEGATICPYDANRIGRPRAAPGLQPSDPPPPATAGVDPFAELALGVELSVHGQGGQRIVSLRTGDRLEIGRDAGPLADLCSDNVSGRHAELRVGDDCVEITDTGTDRRGSTNGTFVDGERLAPNVPARLTDGSVVECGADPPLRLRIRVVSA